MKNENIRFQITEKPININDTINSFYTALSDSTGTIVIHHGKAKYPGKHIKNYKKIEIKMLDNEDNIKEKLFSIASKYNINKIHITHRIGTIYKNDTILFIGVEAVERNDGFNCVREVLEYMKQDNTFSLIELS